MQSLCLFVWSIHEPDVAPTEEYLGRREPNRLFIKAEAKQVSPKEASWNALLDVYSFGAMDDFDRAIFTGVKQGFFDPSLIKTTATALQESLKESESERAFDAAWGKFHNSFEDNQKEVLDELRITFLGAISTITPLNLNATVNFFK